ncbi:MAG: hypothetical protein V1776_01610 [Candidatus Diapherotrites archaeon]
MVGWGHRSAMMLGLLVLSLLAYSPVVTAASGHAEWMTYYDIGSHDLVYKTMDGTLTDVIVDKVDKKKKHVFRVTAGNSEDSIYIEVVKRVKKKMKAGKKIVEREFLFKKCGYNSEDDIQFFPSYNSLVVKTFGDSRIIQQFRLDGELTTYQIDYDYVTDISTIYWLHGQPAKMVVYETFPGYVPLHVITFNGATFPSWDTLI